MASVTSFESFEVFVLNFWVDEGKDNQMELQEEIAKSFEKPLETWILYWTVTSIVDVWPDIRKKNILFRGPTHAALDVRFRLVIDANDMIERSRCFVSTPGFINFTLSREWVARSIHKMIKDESLARMLEYSRVEVIRRFHERDDLDIKSKMMMTEFLLERFPNGEVNDQAIGEPEVLYEESKKRFENDAEFRERAQQLPLADLTALWHALDMVKADWIVHVTDLGKRDYIQVLINAAKRAGCIVTDHCQDSKIRHVEFGLVEGYDVERFVNLDDLLDEAIRCKDKLVRQFRCRPIIQVPGQHYRPSRDICRNFCKNVNDVGIVNLGHFYSFFEEDHEGHNLEVEGYDENSSYDFYLDRRIKVTGDLCVTFYERN
ncbi:anticodon-binding aminoacyl-tRNA synthetase, class 1a [Tanacetum coccineum]